MGALDHYPQRYQSLYDDGVKLINSPVEHLRASELPHWYEQLSDLTPYSMWFDNPPHVDAIEAEFGWPVFIKGVRQTSGHSKEPSIAHHAQEYERIISAYQQNDILHWQAMAVRKLIPLRAVGGGLPTDVPASFEFRTFWCHGQIVGEGRYWARANAYHWTQGERNAALDIASVAAQRLQIPFLVIDLAQTSEGQWIIIECNDAQESGYAGVNPLSLWQEIIRIERERNSAG